MILPFAGLAYTGLVLLGFARGRALRALGRLLTLGVAAGFTALAGSLFQLGHDRGWTGEGPGMLVVMLLVPVAGLLALATWGAVVAQWTLRRSGGVDPRLALAVLAVGVAGSGWQARESARAARPSHDAPVLAVAFAEAGGRLFSLDAAGALKEWDVRRRRVVRAWREPALADARALLVTPDGALGVALGPRGASVVALVEPALPAATLPGVEHAALLPGARLAWTRGGALHVDALPRPDAERAPIALGAPVTALAADREGTLAVALADGRLLAVGGAPREIAVLAAPATELAISPGGAWLVAVDAARRAHRVDVRSGAVDALPDWLGLHLAAFVGDDVLVFTRGAESPEALALALRGAAPAVGPWWNHGRTVTALAGAPGAADAAVALGPELFLARAPKRGGDPAEATRLVHPR